MSSPLAGRHGLVATTLLACAASCSTPASDQPTCTDTSRERLRVGEWDGKKLRVLPERLQIEYGPQGGQHVLVDVLLESACAERFQVYLDFADERSRVVGLGERVVAPTACRVLIEDERVFLEYDSQQRGVLRVYAESEGCRLDAEARDLILTPPF